MYCSLITNEYIEKNGRKYLYTQCIRDIFSPVTVYYKTLTVDDPGYHKTVNLKASDIFVVID